MCFTVPGRLDGGKVLLQTLARFVENIRRNDEYSVGAGEGPLERSRIVEIGGTGLHALRCVVRQFGNVPAGGDNIGRLRLAGCQEGIEHEFAELAGGAGYEQSSRHDFPFFSTLARCSACPVDMSSCRKLVSF